MFLVSDVTASRFWFEVVLGPVSSGPNKYLRVPYKMDPPAPSFHCISGPVSSGPGVSLEILAGAFCISHLNWSKTQQTACHAPTSPLVPSCRGGKGTRGVRPRGH